MAAKGDSHLVVTLEAAVETHAFDDRERSLNVAMRDVWARRYGQGSLVAPGVPLSPPGNVDVEGHQLDA